MFHTLYKVLVEVILPVVCILVEAGIYEKQGKVYELDEVCCKHFIFWTVGMSAFTAGVMQAFNPSYTADLLGVESSNLIVISELGCANMAMGVLALSTWRFRNLRRAAGVTYALYIVGCTILHITRLGHIGLGEMSSLAGDIWLIVVVGIVAIILPMKKKGKVKKN